MASLKWDRARTRSTTSDAAEDARAISMLTAADRRKAHKSRARWVMLPNGKRVHASRIRTHEDYLRACAEAGCDPS